MTPRAAFAFLDGEGEDAEPRDQVDLLNLAESKTP
jgi:hypothetical protein